MLTMMLTLPVVIGAWLKDETVAGFADPGAVYVLQELNGAPVAARATITFPEPGRIAGEGPCNGYSATQGVPYPWFKAGPIAATRRACPDLPLETAFFETLAAATLVEVAGPVLILSNDDGVQMVFQAGPGAGD